jgi:hypothetical protein
MKQTWFDRLVVMLGFRPGSRDALDTLASTSKHARGTAKPRNWQAKRKARRKAAGLSRRRNR